MAIGIKRAYLRLPYEAAIALASVVPFHTMAEIDIFPKTNEVRL